MNLRAGGASGRVGHLYDREVTVVKEISSVRIPDELYDVLGSVEHTRGWLEQLAVIEAVRRHVLSRGQAATLLGVSGWDIDELLAEHDVPTLDVPTLDLDPDELREQNQPLATPRL